MKTRRFARLCIVALSLAASLPALAQKNVVQPGDPIIASSSNSPETEGVANAIDGKTTKYLNFDLATDSGLKPSGFVVSPSVGVTRVTGIRMQTANDGAERDPKTMTLEGSNDATVTAFNGGNWEPIATISVPAVTNRFLARTFTFENFNPYRHYRWTVSETATPNDCCMQVAEVELLGSTLAPDVTQPGDPIIASSSNSPETEGVANAIDNKTTKYLNFDLATDSGLKPSGFVVSPSVGRTVVTGMTIQTANDGAERDPKTVTLEGSNDASITAFNSGTWETIKTFDIPGVTNRFFTRTFLFDNFKPFRHYRWTVNTTATPNDCCMQVAEVELLGRGAPVDVTQPGDAIIASSSNSPETEGVANVIDNKTTKYLNFDLATDSGLKPSGFVVTPSVGATTVTGMTIQTANDGAERDPKTVTLEGSNDDTITAFNSGTWEAITTINVANVTNRFFTTEFFFPNTKSYKHYRWTVIDTATPNDCCMQVAEVELLAVTEGADCNQARFVSQPINTPVLLGSKATFRTVVNGPWPLQWAKNGVAIPGATSGSFTTDTIASANDATNVYTVTIVGCETSQEVRAQVFTPSATKSVAFNFVGGQANGAPTSLADDDILGIQPQAHWNNVGLAPDGSEINDPPNSGTMPDPNADPQVPLLDSDGNASTITMDYATAGDWGAGTGDDPATSSPTDRMLNGLMGAKGPGTQYTFTFNNVPAGAHSLIVYSVAPPKHFATVSYNVDTATIYMRVINSDEYNLAPGLYRGTATTQASATVGDYVRFDNIVVPSDGGIITLTCETLTTFDRETGVNGLQLVLNSGTPGPAPTITAEPLASVAEAGKTATLSVTASGTGLTYQWRKNGRNISNGGNISGATSSTLSISDLSAADAGVYNVAVFNGNGSVISKNATVNVSKYDINDQLVGYWKFDETGTTTTAANSAPGAAANSVGVVNGAANWVAGQVNGALDFDGNTFVYVTNYPKATKAISGSAWVNLNAGTAGDVILFRNAEGNMITSGGATRIVGQFEVGITVDQNTGELRPMAAIGIGPTVARVTGGTAFPTAEWHNVAFTADGAQLRLYVDGQEAAVVDYLADINPPDIQYISMGAQLALLDPMDPTSLGVDQAAPKLLTGQLDDVALWNRALTPQEVSLVYQAGAANKAVTTVVVPKPAGQPTLTVTTTATTITINFGPGAKLQSTTALVPNGSWNDVATTSPYTENSTAGIKFFRAVVVP